MLEKCHSGVVPCSHLGDVRFEFTEEDLATYGGGTPKGTEADGSWLGGHTGDRFVPDRTNNSHGPGSYPGLFSCLRSSKSSGSVMTNELGKPVSALEQACLTPSGNWGRCRRVTPGDDRWKSTGALTAYPMGLTAERACLGLVRAAGVFFGSARAADAGDVLRMGRYGRRTSGGSCSPPSRVLDA